MKKNVRKFFAGVLISSLFVLNVSATAYNNKNVKFNVDGSANISTIDRDGNAVKFNQKFNELSNITKIIGKNVKKKNPINVDLSDFGNKEVMISLSCKMFIDDPDNFTNQIIWMVDEPAENFPVIVQETVRSGEWVDFKGEIIVSLSAKRNLYVSAYGLDVPELTFYIKDFNLKIQGEDLRDAPPARDNWLQAPSLKETYARFFDYFGLACEFKSELNNAEILEGLAYQASSTTMGNEFKPDFLFNWARPRKFVEFKTSTGKTYQMPDNMPTFKNMDIILSIAQTENLKIRGHVLVWHSQTPLWFFKKDFSPSKDAAYVSRDEMDARLEWYIKSVLGHVQDWENAYNEGKRIITVWDVVNEAVDDNAGNIKWLREDSDWFRIYQNEDFIINAFRYANKYAPKDVQLAYNDYNCYLPGKNKAICSLIDKIKKVPDARINVVGMQSHVSVDYPAIRGAGSFEEAVKNFIRKGVDVQITELDIANGNKKYSAIRQKSIYKQYFTMFLDNRRERGKHGISGVTIWGLQDEGTWLNSQPQYSGHMQFPLLFETNRHLCKPAFWGVIEAAQQYETDEWIAEEPKTAETEETAASETELKTPAENAAESTAETPAESTEQQAPDKTEPEKQSE